MTRGASSDDGGNHFLTGGAAYAMSRPTYPAALSDALADRCGGTEQALDVGCGTGQLATLLADRFERVTATDPSAAQLENAEAHPRVSYRMEPAERIGLEDGAVDLVTAAQAAHWFVLDRFYVEARRVLRPGGVLALVSYGVPRMDGAVGERLHRFYWSEIHPHWPEGRRHVEEGYRTLAFPFEEEGLPALQIVREWSRTELVAYLHTWSAVKRAADAGDAGFMRLLERDLQDLWGDGSATRTIRWPIVGRLARL